MAPRRMKLGDDIDGTVYYLEPDGTITDQSGRGFTIAEEESIRWSFGMSNYFTGVHYDGPSDADPGL